MSQKRRRRKLNYKRLAILIAILLVLIIGGTGVGLVFASIKDMPAISQEALESGASTMIYDMDGNLVTQIGIRNSVPVDLKKVPPQLKNAFLAIEDPRFYQHHGISLRGIARAAWTDLTSGSLREGGSTITQQLVRISFLSAEKTYKRKIQEIIMAFQVERRYTKDEILEMYLNNVYLGEGAYGIQAAAQTYFGKNIYDQNLTLEEIALLAGLPQAPSAYSPFLDPKAAKARRNDVLDSMVKYNYISASEAEAAKAKEIKLETKELAWRQYPYPYFLDYITDQLTEKYGEAAVFKGGLKVYTTLDTKIQQIAETAMGRNANFPSSKADENGALQPEGAVVVLDPHTGYIKALVGGREHTQKRQWNRATQTARQPGSAFKPIAAYGPAIEYAGMGPASVVDDIPTSYESYQPHNVDGRYRGLITLRTALTNSVNIVAVKVLMDYVGLANSIKFASNLGITLDPANHGASMALGGLHTGVTPLQMACAYGAFDNQGVYIEPTVIIKVEKQDGVILEQHVPKQHVAMKPTTAFLITDMLRSVVSSGTGTGAQISRPAAGKTGTTDEGKDLWFVGYTPELVAAVWMGYDQPTAMPQAYGGTYPTRVWQEIMSRALSDTPVTSFPTPAGIVSATVDGKSGLLPGPNTPTDSLVTDYFASGTVPSGTDNVHNFIEVCAASGQLPTQYCPDRVIKPLIKLPYAVPPSVEDFALRAPTESCTLHAPGGTQPGKPGAGSTTTPGKTGTKTDTGVIKTDTGKKN
ncbi:transglycosylase domain-containing protein [Pelotomaculum propionicicum]|uniref:Penicillin-binding protein 1A n=1 Tax=Pelotomaculum propionicicum TaxID=258475 RepID=A0A4Y7RPU1_9FIRM|nr:penicillin-binding protein 1A [Pelotomaculum propionicicum]TEB11034.1 Penicillin-binding protein 1A [Pelotomaculum propionicicum]